MNAAVHWLSTQADAMDAHLASLVSQNSFTENRAGGNAVGQLLLELFSIPGLRSQTIESKVYANHLVFESDGNGTAPLALVGHLDTVFPPGTFEGYQKDGALRRGPGVLDMKGGLLVMAYAVKALALHGGLDAVAPLRIVIVSDEEVGSPEGRSVIEKATTGCRAALVFESGREKDAIITRRKGTGVFRAVAHGKAAHAGNNHMEGKNAIWALSRFIDGVQSFTAYDEGITVNVGKVSGGRSKNTVPDFAEAQGDFRFVSKAQGDAVWKRCHHLSTTAAVEGTRLELEGGVSRLPLEKTPESEALLASYAAQAKAVGLGFGEAPLVGGGSDASTTSALGIPSIDGLGPRGKGFHTLEEFIEFDTLIPKAQALARWLMAMPR